MPVNDAQIKLSRCLFSVSLSCNLPFIARPTIGLNGTERVTHGRPALRCKCDSSHYPCDSGRCKTCTLWVSISSWLFVPETRPGPALSLVSFRCP